MVLSILSWTAVFVAFALIFPHLVSDKFTKQTGLYTIQIFQDKFVIGARPIERPASSLG